MRHETALSPPADELAAEKRYFDAVFDSMSDGVLVCDVSMTVTRFNAAAEQITGWERQKAMIRDKLLSHTA
jgi:PAS domain S-box-containing protein